MVCPFYPKKLNSQYLNYKKKNNRGDSKRINEVVIFLQHSKEKVVKNILITTLLLMSLNFFLLLIH